MVPWHNNEVLEAPLAPLTYHPIHWMLHQHRSLSNHNPGQLEPCKKPITTIQHRPNSSDQVRIAHHYSLYVPKSSVDLKMSRNRKGQKITAFCTGMQVFISRQNDMLLENIFTICLKNGNKLDSDIQRMNENFRKWDHHPKQILMKRWVSWESGAPPDSIPLTRPPRTSRIFLNTRVSQRTFSRPHAPNQLPSIAMNLRLYANSNSAFAAPPVESTCHIIDKWTMRHHPLAYTNHLLSAVVVAAVQSHWSCCRQLDADLDIF